MFFKFGGVDAEFVWNFQRIRDGETSFSVDQFSAFAERSVAQYMSFVEKITAIVSPRRMVILSIFPPCLSDAKWAQGYVNGHIGYLETDQAIDDLKAATLRLEIPNLETRTAMHAIYNEELRRGAARLGVRFADDFTPLLAECGKVIDTKYFAKYGGRDHHIDGVPAEPILIDLIKSGLSF